MQWLYPRGRKVTGYDDDDEDGEEGEKKSCDVGLGWTGRNAINLGERMRKRGGGRL